MNYSGLPDTFFDRISASSATNNGMTGRYQGRTSIVTLDANGIIITNEPKIEAHAYLPPGLCIIDLVLPTTAGPTPAAGGVFCTISAMTALWGIERTIVHELAFTA